MTHVTYLILGARGNGLAIARCLRARADTHAVDCIRRPEAGCSRYLRAYHLLPKQATDSMAFFRKFAVTHEQVVLYATDDGWADFINTNQDLLSKLGYLFFSTDPKSFAQILDKYRLYQALSKEVPMPFTTPYTLDIQVKADQVIKSRRSFHQGHGIPKGIDQSAARRLYERGIPLLVQQRIQAPLNRHLSISGILYGGHLHHPLVTRKIAEHPSPMGTATLVQTIICERTITELRELAATLLERLAYEGIFEMEFIQTQDCYYLIEINPRFWLQHALGQAIGINYARYYRDLLLGHQSPQLPLHNRAVVWVHEGVIVNLIRSGNRREILQTIITSKLRILHYFNATDPRPFLCHLLRRIAGN